MIYLIILLVVAMILTPVIALKPNRKQQRQMLLREHARGLGLQVQVCELPQIRRHRVRREDTQQGVAYRLPWRHEQAQGLQFHYLLHRQEVEANTAPALIRQALQQALQRLPATFVAVDFTPAGVAAYWRENGDTETVNDIADTLSALKEQLEPLSLAMINRDAAHD